MKFIYHKYFSFNVIFYIISKRDDFWYICPCVLLIQVYEEKTLLELNFMILTKSYNKKIIILILVILIMKWSKWVANLKKPLIQFILIICPLHTQKSIFLWSMWRLVLFFLRANIGLEVSYPGRTEIDDDIVHCIIEMDWIKWRFVLGYYVIRMCCQVVNVSSTEWW